MNLYSFSIKRPVTIVMAVIAVIVFSFISLDRLNTNLLPNISYPNIAVAVIYPNADPDTVESVVTVELERLMRSVPNVKDVNSTSMENVSICQVVFNWGTDLEVAEKNMKSNLERLKFSVPDDVQDPLIVKFDTSMIPVLMLTVGTSGDMGDVTKLLNETVSPAIQGISGVAGISIVGAADKVINVLYDQEALAETGLTVNLLQQYLSYQNISVPSGSITDAGTRYNLKVGSKFESIEDIEDLIIGMKKTNPDDLPPGIFGLGLMMQPLTIGDIAIVEETYDTADGYTRINGKMAISLSIYAQADASPVTVSEGVQKALEDLRVSHPDLEIGIVFDQADYINKSIGDIVQNALFGALFAILVILLFLKSVKSTVIIAVSIPLSILITIIGMLTFKQTLNLMTLGGLSLGIGMLVDCSIVVIDSIYRRLEYGDSPREAALNGTKEVGAAILASTATTLVIFIPLVFAKGLVSELFTSLAITVVIAIASSLLVALTVIPLMASKFLKTKDVKNKATKVNDGGAAIEGASNKLYKKVLNWSIKNPLGVFGGVLAMLIAAALVIPSIGFGLLPKMDMGRVDVAFSLPNGTSLEITDEASMIIEDKILALEDVESIATIVGVASTDDYTSIASGASVNSGTFSIMVRDNHVKSIDEIGNEIRKIIAETALENPELPEITSSVDVTGMGRLTAGDTFDIFSTSVSYDIYGNDTQILMDLAAQVEEKLKSNEMFTDVINNAKFAQPVLRLGVNRATALFGGLTVGQIGLGVRNSVVGVEATKIERDGESIPVIIKPQTQDGMSLDELLGIPISASLDGLVAGGGSLSSLMGGDSMIGGSGEPIILDRVVKPQEEEGSFTVTRKNGARYTTVSASYLDSTQSQAAKVADALIKDIDVPEGYRIQSGGSSDLLSDTMSDMKLVAFLAILLVYMVMAIQYESFIDPLIIMFTLPLAVIGAILFIKLWGLEIGITAIIGLITLIGIVVNNAIFMVDYINQLRATGIPIREAVGLASDARLRPVMMTALTTISALIPMMLGIGKGSELQTPMGVAVSGGMIFATFLTLIVIPTLYLVVHNFVDKFKHKEV